MTTKVGRNYSLGYPLYCTQFKLFLYFASQDILTTIVYFYRVPIKLISNKVVAWFSFPRLFYNVVITRILIGESDLHNHRIELTNMKRTKINISKNVFEERPDMPSVQDAATTEFHGILKNKRNFVYKENFVGSKRSYACKSALN